MAFLMEPVNVARPILFWLCSSEDPSVSAVCGGKKTYSNEALMNFA